MKRFKHYGLIVLGFTVVLGTHLALTCFYLYYGKMGSDEGFYALAARSVMEGKIPYLDFAYTQMPLLPYWNGLAMEIVGYGLVNQRLVNIVWSCLALIGVVLALYQRFGRWEPGLAAAFTVVASPHWAKMQAIGTSHSAAGMFLGLSAAVSITTYPLLKRVAAFAFLGTMAMGCRLSNAPVVAVLALILLIESKGWRQRVLVAAIIIGSAAITLLPFWLAAPEAAIFNVWEYHMASVFNRRSLHQMIEWWCISPAAILVLAAGMMMLPRLIIGRRWDVVLLLLAALVGVTTPMIPKSAYGCYITPVAIVAATAGMSAIWTADSTADNPLRHIFWLIPLLVLLHPLPKRMPEPTAATSEIIGSYLRDEVPRGPVLTPIPIVAVEAERQVVPGTEMGMFSAMHPQDHKLARRLRLVTLYDLISTISKREPAAIVRLTGGAKWNFKWTVPTLRRQPKKLYKMFEKAIKKNYKIVKRHKNIEVLVPRL